MNLLFNNIKTWKSISLILAFALATGLLMVSCVEEVEVFGTDVEIGLTKKDSEGVAYDVEMPEDYVCEFKKKGGEQYFYIRSDIGAWTLATDEEYEKFVKIWPNRGKNDGRFGVEVVENPTAYEQNFNINVINAAGTIMGSVPFMIEPSDPFLSINYSTTPKYVASIGESFTVRVKANIAWEATSLTDWVEIGEFTDSTQVINILKNEGSLRDGLVTFSMVGETGEAILNLKQLDLASDFAQATKVTITDLMTRIDASGVGSIEENLYIEGYVISNKDRQALPRTQMVVQDESNRGVWIEFSNDEDNICEVNDKVKIHMYGASFVIDEQTKASRIESFSPSFVHDITPSAGITPISITDLTQVDQYENVLVTLEQIEFPLAYGTYVNIAEAQYNKRPANWTITADKSSDDTSDYGHLVKDKHGNYIKMYTNPIFLDRFKVNMPKGSGSLTGIIMKRVKDNVESHIIRIRSHEDNLVSTDAGTALSKVIMQFGPWPVRVDYPAIVANVGSGVLEFSGRANQNTSVASTPDAIYFASSQARLEPAELKPDGSAVSAYKNDLSYWGVNTQYWWANPSSSISGGSSGEAWIISTSTLSATGPGDLYMEFASSSSTTGPCHFDIEWSESKDTPFAEWNKITEYTVCDINNTQHLMQYYFKLPDELKGKANLVIRLRVNSRERATRNGNNIGTSGTNRLGLLKISQLK